MICVCKIRVLYAPHFYVLHLKGEESLSFGVKSWNIFKWNDICQGFTWKQLRGDFKSWGELHRRNKTPWVEAGRSWTIFLFFCVCICYVYISTIKSKMEKEKKESKATTHLYLYAFKSSAVSTIPDPNSLDLKRATALSSACRSDVSSLPGSLGPSSKCSRVQVPGLHQERRVQCLKLWQTPSLLCETSGSST